MNCTKCNHIIHLPHNRSTIYFLSEYNHLMIKIDNFFKSLNNNGILQDQIYTYETISAQEFFEQNVAAFTNYFNEYETDDIKVFIDDGTSKFDFKAILSAKPLSKYLTYIEDKDFFNIITNGSLTSHFQPIVDVKSGNIYAFEALTRGVCPNGKLMYPDQLFFKSARNDMNFRLDRLCRESALKTAATKRIKQKVFINFIPTSIYDPEFCLQSTVKWAKQLEFDPKNIVFEVVETEQVDDKEHLKKILQFYRDQGFSIALDDVGEGYSGLNNLIDLKPDIIKVDRNVISNIDADQMKQSVYKALYSLAKENGIEVLAEGIETKEELEMVKSIGVDYAQGYYYAKPNPEPIRSLI